MRFKLATAIGIGVLLVAATATPANAATNRIRVGSSGTLTNRLLITVSVTIACGPLPDTPFDSGAAVSLQQAAGEHIRAASGSVYNAFTGPNAPLLTCDGVTQNAVVLEAVPNSGSGPFHGGQASVSASFFYDTGISCGLGCVETTNSEGGSIPWLTISLH